MDREPPLLIDLPPLSDRSAAEIQRLLEALTTQFESRYALQIRRYYDKHPRLERPAKFTGEPF